MQVVMRVALSWQHIGREVPLSSGETYELPDAIAVALVSAGQATPVTLPPEIKPDPVMVETKRARTRASEA
jgi:hypothetical protein